MVTINTAFILYLRQKVSLSFHILGNMSQPIVEVSIRELFKRQ